MVSRILPISPNVGPIFVLPATAINSSLCMSNYLICFKLNFIVRYNLLSLFM
jgi:hypothetical protein